MITINKQEIEINISHLLDIVASGEEISIIKGGEIFAKIVPISEILTKPRPPRVFGVDAGKGWISKDFDAPLPEQVLRDFGC
jgi:antitoxin (DNA-binding transcriptional repressor) of toxin-antitoxin stability system